jgi:outer membrane receptor protein involved in Fe transport
VSFEQTELSWADSLRVSGLIGRYEHRIDQDRLAAPGRPRRIDRADISGTDVQLRAVARKGLGGGRLMAGVDYNGRRDLEAHDITMRFNGAGDLTSTKDTPSIGSARRSDAGAFAQFDLPIAAAVTLVAGGRFDQVRSVNVGGFFGDRAVSHGAASGQVSVAARPSSQLTLTAQISRGFRDPTLSDRFYRGPVGRGFIVGNPDLDPERSVQLDVTARYDADRWRVNAAYYHYDISDLIERYAFGDGTFLFRNRGLARIRGGEIEVQVEMGAGVVLDLAAQAARGHANDDGAGLNDVAPHSFVLQARKMFGTSVFVSTRVAVIARDSVPGPGEVATPGYVEAGATTSWHVSQRLELRAAASNLLDRRYYSSPGPRWVLAPGRSGTLAAIVKF